MIRRASVLQAALPALAAAAAAAFALALAAAAPASASATVWLCRPGLAGDPCNPGLSMTVFSTSTSSSR